MLGSAAKVWCCLLALLLLREASGATFFRQHGAEHGTQICNESSAGENATWWVGKKGSSLLTFEQGSCCSKGILYSKTQNSGNCPNNVSLRKFTSGGIFACKTQMEHQELQNKTPLFSSREDCTDFNFFIVAKIESSAEQTSENIQRKAEEKASIGQNQNLTLSCEFELAKDTTTFAVYWLKGTEPSKCLFSATNEGHSTYFDISYDINCCIEEAFRERRINSSITSGEKHRNQKHVVTITNRTAADEGSYFCLVAAYTSRRTYTWSIERRVSVRGTEAPPLSYYLPISLAAIAGFLLLMAGIVLLLCCRKKRKGKPVENQQRDKVIAVAEDCSPYAVSSHNDLSGQETVYSLATSPGEVPSALRFNPTPGVQHGENVQVLYSKVSKNRSGPTLAPDSSV